ncbi:bloated tubules, partial [Asbolus verrucosus]
SCQTWFTHLETVLCTISLAAGFGNLYRLPQTTLLRGGLPFLLAYVILTILIGLPLLFLELGIGQLAQEGFIKSWRAVPFFRGIGYVKLIAGCLLSIYYPLYMGLSLYYIIWVSHSSIPFSECARVKMKEVDSAHKKFHPILIYPLISNAGTALGFIIVNLLFGVGTVVICYIFSGELKQITPETGDVAELHLISLIYTILVHSEEKDQAKIWAIIAYAAILLAGFISMATITYTLLKAITVQNRRRLKWWQTSIVLSFIGLVLGCAVLLEAEFKIVRLLDHYIVGNLILISVIVEVFALIAFYGTERIKSDFEFMLGHILSNVWLILWWLLPLLLTGIFAWALITLPYEDTFMNDPEWLSGTGWAIVLTAAIFIFVIGFHTTTKQDGYTIKDRFKASLKPSNNWGPKDPMQRHTWVQWNTKAKNGERDFTLKRKGTRDYTRSVKRHAKKAISDSTLNRTIKNDQNQNVRTSNSSTEYVEPYYIENEQTSTLTRIRNEANRKPLRVTSLVDSLDPPSPSFTVNVRNTYNGGFKTHINPLSRTHEVHDSSNSEGYGTFRKGPYIIPDTNITHVCHRRFSQSEDATEL